MLQQRREEWEEEVAVAASKGFFGQFLALIRLFMREKEKKKKKVAWFNADPFN